MQPTMLADADDIPVLIPKYSVFTALRSPRLLHFGDYVVGGPIAAAYA